MSHGETDTDDEIFEVIEVNKKDAAAGTPPSDGSSYVSTENEKPERRDQKIKRRVKKRKYPKRKSSVQLRSAQSDYDIAEYEQVDDLSLRPRSCALREKDDGLMNSRKQSSHSIGNKIDEQDKLETIIEIERQRIVQLNQQQFQEEVERLETGTMDFEETKKRRRELKYEMKKKVSSFTSEERLKRMVLGEQTSTKSSSTSTRQRSMFVENSISGKFLRKYRFRERATILGECNVGEDGQDSKNLRDSSLEEMISHESRKFRVSVREMNQFMLSFQSLLRGFLAGTALMQIFITFIPSFTIERLLVVNSSFSAASQVLFSFLATSSLVCSTYLLFNDFLPPTSVLAVEEQVADTMNFQDRRDAGPDIRERQISRMIIRMIETICNAVIFFCSIGTAPSNAFFTLMQRKNGQRWFEQFVTAEKAGSDNMLYVSRIVLWLLFCCTRGLISIVPWTISALFLRTSTSTRQDQLFKGYAKRFSERWMSAYPNNDSG